MPSPFPGMDPYLEDPRLWPDVHHRLITIASDLLSVQVRPKYYVRVEERVYISDEGDPARREIVPDLRIGEVPDWGGPPPAGVGAMTTGVAEPIVARTWFEEEVREAYLVVIEREGREVVTVIEVISPSNKAPGSAARESFEQKRREVKNSPSHWVEIDLLRGGTPLTTVPPHHRPYEYLVHVSRRGMRPNGFLWPIRLSQRLPAITVPLRPEDGETKLDLQAVLNTAYDRAGYDLQVDYRRDARPPLVGEWVGWADRLLRDKGLR